MDVMQAERPRKTKANRFKEAMEAEEAEVWERIFAKNFHLELGIVFFATLYDVV